VGIRVVVLCKRQAGFILTQLDNILLGIGLGAIVASPIVVFILRGRLAKELTSASTAAEQLRTELETTRARLTDERVIAASAQARAEEAARSATSLAQMSGAGHDAIVEELNAARAEVERLRVDLATKNIRAEEAERTLQRGLADKQAACDQLIESERKSQQQSREALAQSYEAAILRLTAHLEMRNTEHEKAIAALNESQVATEAALRQGFDAQVRAKEEQLNDIKEYLRKADETLREVFGDASARALQRASESFFEIAKKRFDERDETAKTNADAHKQELERLLEPVKEELGELEKLNRQIEKERAESFGSLKETIQNLNKSNESLANALKKPSVRGSWGEGQLLSILESSGWVQGQNFDVQDVTDDDGITLRTDVVIHLPRGRKIIIDSKAPLDQYMAAMEAENDEERVRRCTEHARAVRAHVKALEKKEYWARYTESPPYVILFMPYEAAYQIACEYDRALLDEAHRSRIILANPMTLMNLVHLATFVLNEERLQQNAEEVRHHGKQLCERLGKVLELMTVHGRHIRIAAESYNTMVASVGSRLLPAASRIRELGAGAEKPLSVPDSVDTAIRHLIVPELATGLFSDGEHAGNEVAAESPSLFLVSGNGEKVADS
jgi:DNA recombination protein RmuC